MISPEEFFNNKYFIGLDLKKKSELFAVYNFLKNEGLDIQIEKFDVNPQEPSDIVYAETNFQVTTGSSNIDAVLGILKKKKTAQVGNAKGKIVEIGEIKARMYESISNFNENESIKNEALTPVQIKINQYGMNNVTFRSFILLIYSFSQIISPNHKIELEKIRNENLELFKLSGFKKIYLSDQEKNILIFSR